MSSAAGNIGIGQGEKPLRYIGNYEEGGALLGKTPGAISPDLIVGSDEWAEALEKWMYKVGELQAADKKVASQIYKMLFAQEPVISFSALEHLNRLDSIVSTKQAGLTMTKGVQTQIVDLLEAERTRLQRNPCKQLAIVEHTLDLVREVIANSRAPKPEISR